MTTHVTEAPVGQRLKILIKDLELSTRSFCKVLDVSETTVRNYFNRGSKPNAEFLERLVNSFPQVNLSWLLTGKGEPFLVNTTQSDNLQQTNIKNNSGIGISNGGTHTTTTNLNIHDCQRELEASQKEIEHLQQKLQLTEALLASKEETITLLRISYNRPN